MYCPICGEPNPIGNNSCYKCNQDLKKIKEIINQNNLCEKCHSPMNIFQECSKCDFIRDIQIIEDEEEDESDWKEGDIITEIGSDGKIHKSKIHVITDGNIFGSKFSKKKSE